MHKPWTSYHAFELVPWQEQVADAMNCNKVTNTQNNPTSNLRSLHPPFSPKTPLPAINHNKHPKINFHSKVQKGASQYPPEGERNSFCNHCGRRYFTAYKCKLKKVMPVEECEEEKDENEENQELYQQENRDDSGILSLQVIEGISLGETVRIRGLFNKKTIMILLNSGSSHSFMDSYVTKGFQNKVVHHRPWLMVRRWLAKESV